MASRRLKIFVWICAAVAAIVIISTATVAFVVFKTMKSTAATAETANASFAEVRRLYPNRPPLIEIANADIRTARVNRTPNAPRKNIDTIYFMYWNAEDQKIVRGEAPMWVTNMRVSIFGVGNWSFSDFHVTREDIERYSPGLIMDFKAPDGNQVLAWTR